MDEKEILGRIERIVAEEHELRERRQRQELGNAEEQERLKQLEVALDQCWDLLRQRRARLAAGQDPQDAQSRPASEVENYLQ